MEKHYCEICEKDITEENFLELGSREGRHGIRVPRLIGEFCSLGCIETWISRQRRAITKTTEKENGEITKETYWNHELKKEFDLSDLQKEDGKLCVKPEVWDELVKD